MRLPLFVIALCAVSACVPTAQVSKNRSAAETGVGFGPLGGLPAVTAPAGAPSMARDFMDLTFAMESGKGLGVFSRFEGPVTVGLSGTVPSTAGRDLADLVGRLRSEAGIDIATTSGPATITVQFTSRSDLRRLAPQAACFVVPNVSSLAEYRRLRGTAAVDWARTTRRERAAIFIPADTSPQEVRDCLHEELAQAMGPLNDLYRLSDSVFNDDNFHSVLTGFDMEVLRLTYSPGIASGMTEAEVGARLFGTTAGSRTGTPANWVREIEKALGRKDSLPSRQAAADRALALALTAGWSDSRTAFSWFAVGKLSAGSNPARALEAFDQAAAIYRGLPGGEVQLAHIDMQLAAIALAAGLPDEAARIAGRAAPIVKSHGNAALFATLMLIRAEALERMGDSAAATALRLDSAPYASYGFGPDSVVKARVRDIAAVADRAENG
jgi:Protein of unknown function (DUF2927)